MSWLGIVRLGLVQTALGAIFVLSTSTLNRVMKVELALPATLPGLLIAWQYGLQVLRPRLGHGSDVGGRRTPLILGGMITLAAGGVLAAWATATMTQHLWLGIGLGFVAFTLIGIGVSAAGTSLLVLLATRTAPARRPAAAGIAWLMMIAGFIVTAGLAGKLLAPFSPTRLVVVAAIIAGLGVVVTILATWDVETRSVGGRVVATETSGSFSRALADVWNEPRARRFALFVFVSMLAYGGEELMIEPFAGSIFGFSAAETAKLSGVLHAGSLAGMVLVALIATAVRRASALRPWMVAGCLGSAGALAGLAACGLAGSPSALRPLLGSLGLANGIYALAAIGAMMQRIGGESGGKEGTRMGLWGAAQALAFGAGGLGATALSDGVQAAGGHDITPYVTVFCAQAIVFLVAALMAARLDAPLPSPASVPAAVRR